MTSIFSCDSSSKSDSVTPSVHPSVLRSSLRVLAGGHGGSRVVKDGIGGGKLDGQVRPRVAKKGQGGSRMVKGQFFHP